MENHSATSFEGETSMTLIEIIDLLNRELSDEAKAELRSVSVDMPYAMIDYHFGLGMHIRNKGGLHTKDGKRALEDSIMPLAGRYLGSISPYRAIIHRMQAIREMADEPDADHRHVCSFLFFDPDQASIFVLEVYHAVLNGVIDRAKLA